MLLNIVIIEIDESLLFERKCFGRASKGGILITVKVCHFGCLHICSRIIDISVAASDVCSSDCTLENRVEPHTRWLMLGGVV